MENRIKFLRNAKNITQSELAEILGVNQTAVGKYERGDLEPNLTILTKIADYFVCTVDYLIGREDELGNVMLASEALSESEQRLVELFRAMPEARQRTVLDMMQAMTDGSNANVRKSHA